MAKKSKSKNRKSIDTSMADDVIGPFDKRGFVIIASRRSAGQQSAAHSLIFDSFSGVRIEAGMSHSLVTP
jgi:hypothetical protein